MEHQDLYIGLIRMHILYAARAAGFVGRIAQRPPVAPH
jgi:hypothetical protein